MGWILIILGFSICFIWANDVARGRSDIGKIRLAHLSSAFHLLVYGVAFTMIIIGIILLLTN